MDFLELIIRKWLLTICDELQLPIPPQIVIRSEIPFALGFARENVIHLNGILNSLSEEAIIFVLAHELRHVYQFTYFPQWLLKCSHKNKMKEINNLVRYGIAEISDDDYNFREEEIDANTYAKFFIERNYVPYRGTYSGEIFFPNEIGKLISARDFNFTF